MSNDDDVTGRQKGIQSVEVAFSLIQPFLGAPGPFTLSSLAQAADMAPSKAAFYLRSLVTVGFLVRSGRAYALGPTALQIGLSALAQIDVIEAVQAPLHALRDALGMPLFLSVWAENGPTIVQHLHGARTSAWSMQVGAVLPALSATGRALLAYAERDYRAGVIDRALREASPDDPWHGATLDEILAVLTSIRDSGISPRSGAVIPGYGSIAAAILDRDGSAAAAVTIISDLRSPHELDSYAAPLLSAVAEGSRLIGGSHPSRAPGRAFVQQGRRQE